MPECGGASGYVARDHGARADGCPIPDGCFGFNDGAGPDHHFASDAGLSSGMNSGADMRVIADVAVMTQASASIDDDVGAYPATDPDECHCADVRARRDGRSMPKDGGGVDDSRTLEPFGFQ